MAQVFPLLRPTWDSAMLARPEMRLCSSVVAIFCAPYRIQNPSDPQHTPQNTPRTLSRNQNTKKYKKYAKIGGFRIFFVFFRTLVSGEDSGCILGGIFGDQRGFVFCTGRRRSQFCRPKHRANRLLQLHLKVNDTSHPPCNDRIIAQTERELLAIPVVPRKPNDQKNLISIEIFDLARNF